MKRFLCIGQRKPAIPAKAYLAGVQLKLSTTLRAKHLRHGDILAGFVKASAVAARQPVIPVLSRRVRVNFHQVGGQLLDPRVLHLKDIAEDDIRLAAFALRHADRALSDNYVGLLN